MRHFLSLNDLDRNEFLALVERAIVLKREQRQGHTQQNFLVGKNLAMIFEKSSTRTRVSFEAAMNQLGGAAIFLSPGDSQLGRGEPIEDTARVLSKMVDIVVVRTYEHKTLECFAANATIPVINGLSDLYHPCQLLADIQTWTERRGSISGHTVAWLGDGNNMCHSWINAAHLLGFNLNIACPEHYFPDAGVVNLGPDNILITQDPVEAVTGANLIVTDVWASMGQEEEQERRRKKFFPYQVNQRLMAMAPEEALFMHCLPAHRGDEVTAEVIDGPQSVVWDEAGNRLHTQKSLLEFLLK